MTNSEESIKGVLVSIPNIIKNFIYSTEISKNIKLGVLIVICLILLGFNGINVLGFVQSYMSKVMSWATFVIIVVGIYLFLKSRYDSKIKLLEKEIVFQKARSK